MQTHNKALLSQPSAAGTACCAVRPKAWRYGEKLDVVLEDNNLRIANGSGDEKKG